VSSAGLFVFLHNLGGNMMQFQALANVLTRRGLICVFPNGPFQLDPAAEQAFRFAWRIDGSGWVPAFKSLRSVLRSVRVQFPGERPLILAGFSQGATLAFLFGLRQATHADALVCLSPSRPDDAVLRAFSQPSRPVFLAHGTADAEVPIEIGQEYCRLLVHHQHRVTYTEYSMGHELSLSEIRDLGSWLETEPWKHCDASPEC
jgi:phospholipase/carboxylesterase